jgi:hypothetical protein
MPTTGQDALILSACALAIVGGVSLFLLGLFLDPVRAARRALTK